MSVKQQFWKTQQEELQSRLSKLEECVETPFVPGELEGWLQATHEALEEVIPHLKLQMQHVHAEEFAEIAEEDPELWARVESMQAEDQAIAERCEEIRVSLKSLREREEKGATETDLKQDLDDFVAASLDFLNRVRKQEVTIRTWLMEAFNRDRGTVD